MNDAATKPPALSSDAELPAAELARPSWTEFVTNAATYLQAVDCAHEFIRHVQKRTGLEDVAPRPARVPSFYGLRRRVLEFK